MNQKYDGNQPNTGKSVKNTYNNFVGVCIGLFKKLVRITLNYLRSISIQFVITASFIFVTTIAIVFVGIALTNRVRTLAEENAAVNTRQIINQVNSNLDYYLRNMMEISNHLIDIIRITKTYLIQSLLSR